MSFGFDAIGSRDGVIAQLNAVNLDNGGQLAADARQIILSALDGTLTASGPDHEYAYIVRAAGHSGGGAATTLNITIEPRYVPTIARDAGSEADDDQEAAQAV